MCRLTKMRFMRPLAKSMRMDKATNPQNLSKKSLKEIIVIYIFEEESKFPQWWGKYLGRGEKAGKVEEKHKTALKCP